MKSKFAELGIETHEEQRDCLYCQRETTHTVGTHNQQLDRPNYTMYWSIEYSDCKECGNTFNETMERKTVLRG